MPNSKKAIAPVDTATVHKFTQNCEYCRHKNLCLPANLSSDEVYQLEKIVDRRKLLQRNEHLFQIGDAFDSLYIVRGGVLKTYTTTSDNREQVTGFCFPGQLLGVDGIAEDWHTSSAVALETSAMCQIPYSQLLSLAATSPKLLRHILSTLSRKVIEDQQLLTLLGKHSAEERAATMLMQLAHQNADLKLSESRIRLSMRRVDIANYLGLTEETISRVFARMQKLQILDINNREITILDMAALMKIVNSDSFATVSCRGQRSSP